VAIIRWQITTIDPCTEYSAGGGYQADRERSIGDGSTPSSSSPSPLYNNEQTLSGQLNAHHFSCSALSQRDGMGKGDFGAKTRS
jgi:hypothetical protein